MRHVFAVCSVIVNLEAEQVEHFKLALPFGMERVKIFCIIFA